MAKTMTKDQVARFDRIIQDLIDLDRAANKETYEHGVFAEACDGAKTAIRNVLIVAEVYMKCENAAEAHR